MAGLVGNGWIAGHCTGGAAARACDAERGEREMRALRPRQACVVRHPRRGASRCARRRFHAGRAGIGPAGETR
ncbi:hypothetical protein A8D95_17580 [Burkholderia cenocepacia]|uniref:Uncharacterized protein n=1 Tax=Burkholderia cenocepacia TaxID=95486 RepID=A0A1V2WBH2_9BURK|nr:hypothetical protein A8D83_16615 [Burkholderia cenocepacia]ONJ32069.1 hypothetical protein A8D90_01130 [Burkholderia cenocepacia]ONP25081.1 hypothetical protein A8D84_23550 [Burkholderia cenocepacia]ONP38493.1 hypothetical protein A8D86_21940 [Burkholderia cenocepacia]ONP45317.1 hypothetical protein A8D85_03570 [Burkholderia cenocepacia]